MLKKLLLIGLPVILIGAGVYAYIILLKKSQEHFKLIPSDSIGVMTIDLKSIAEKGNYKAWGDLFVTKKLNESTKPDAENGRFMKELIGNPLSMGIDPVSDLYLFFQYSAKSQPSFGIALAVRNESDLENVLMKIPEKDLSVDKKEVQNKEGYKLFHFS